MNITEPSLHFDLLSVIELHLPAQDCIISPRTHSTLSFRVQGDAVISWQGDSARIENNSVLFIPAGCSYHIRSGQEVVLCINLHISEHASLQPEFFTLLLVKISLVPSL